MDNMTNKENTGNEPTFIDILNMPLGEAFSALIGKGAKLLSGIKQGASEIFNAYADEEYAKLCRPVLTMSDCVNWMKIQMNGYPNAGFFFIFVQETTSPRNENDKLSITLALLDRNKKPIPAAAPVRGAGSMRPFSKPQKQGIVAVAVPAGTIDIRLINALNGTSSVLVEL